LPLLFEGAEKKAEIFIDRALGSLLNDIPTQYWHQLVAIAGAKILSCIETSQCRAYLLSESSLFVWHDRLLILTCGTTHLAKALEFFVLTQPQAWIIGINYQRKNEYFSQQQPSCFRRDIDVLQQHLAGKSYVSGDLNGHHNQLFQYRASPNKNSKVPPTYELLAYQISPRATDIFTAGGLTTSAVSQFLGLCDLLQQFTIDEHFFSPFGYSLNALQGDDYLTIHITPQVGSSYVSIISNLNLLGLIAPMLTKLRPQSFDVLVISEEKQPVSLESTINDYGCYNRDTDELYQQHHLDYLNFKLRPIS